MSAVFAGVNLCQTTPEIREWIERNIPLSELREFNWPSAPPAIFPGLTYYQNIEANIPIRLNVLRWPSGASRWGTYHFVATDEQLTLIRAAVFGDPSTDPPEAYKNAYGKLVLHGAGETVTVERMYLLAPKPLSATPLGAAYRNRLWLCTLVDSRYWWNHDHCGNLSDEDAGTWDNLLTALRKRTGLPTNAWDCPAVDASYLFPNHELQDINSLPLGMVIEAVAWNVGRRVSLDMELTSMSYPPVMRIRDYDWHNTRLQSNLTNANWYRLAGDDMELAGRDLSSIIPEKFRMTFANDEDSRVDLDLAVNSIVGYESFVGTGTVVFHNRLDVSEASASQRTALLSNFANAWLSFQKAGTPNISYTNHAKWLPEGITDAVEWHEEHGDGSELVPDPTDGKVRKRKLLMDMARTRVTRLPYNLTADDLWHGGSGTGSGSGGTSGQNTIDCGDGSTPRTFTISRIGGAYHVEVAPEEE